MTNHCDICNSEFDDFLYYNCGGTCLLCMARIGHDPDCAVEAVQYLYKENVELKQQLEKGI